MTVRYDAAALEDMENLQEQQRKSILQKISLLSDPQFQHYMLKGLTRDGQKSYRARAGRYRILYTKSQAQGIVIYGIRQRKDAYR